MKNHLKVLLTLVIISSISTPCSANPLSTIFSFFQRDLVINVLYKDHKNLIQDTEVYLAQNPMGQKILIGKVTKVSLIEPQMSKVEIIVAKKYKENLSETTPFVLMSNPFSENSNSYIVAISSLEKSNKPLLKSGHSINGVTFLEYKIAIAGQKFKKIMGSLKKQNNELMDQLEQYIENFDSKAFQEKMDDLINKLSEFSAEQKETFKNEVLPSLRKTFDSMTEKLNDQDNMEKSKNLKKQLMEIEDIVDV